MGRRADHTREELKKLLIDTAFELVEKKGLKEFNARTITKTIGYSVGTLYNLVDGMDGLMLYINIKTLDGLLQAIKRGVSRMRDSLNMGAVVARNYLKFAKEHPALWALLYESPTKERPSWYKNKIDETFSELEVLFAPYIGGEPAKRKRTCQILWASLHGICQLDYRGKLSGEKAEELCNELFQTYLKGYQQI